MGEHECHHHHHSTCCGEAHKEEHCCHDHKEEHLKFLLDVADCAWKEALKEKIKEHILDKKGKEMAELAKIISEANNERWKHKMQKKKGIKEFKENLAHFFEKKK